MSSYRHTWHVDGMHCVQCEAAVKRILAGKHGLSDICVNYRKGTLTAMWDPDAIPEENIAGLLSYEGYTLIGKHDRQSIWREALRFLLLLAMVAGLYWLVNNTSASDWINSVPVVRAGMSFGMLFVIGLMTSVHCVSMCGGISLAQSAVSARKGYGSCRTSLMYNIGRVISYTIVGGFVGALGTTFSVSHSLKAVIQITAAVFMLIMALNLLGGFSWLNRLSLTLPKGFSSRVRIKSAGHSSFVIGLANSLMPCGPLQAMQLFALSAGSWWRGALSMLCFSLGTVPLMLCIGMLGGKLNQKHAHYMHVFSGFLVIMMGISMLSSGLALAGVDVSASSKGEAGMAVIQNGVQYVQADIDYGSYPTITVQNGIPVCWTLIAEDGKLNGCNNEIVIPAYDMTIQLHSGNNVIEFTPDQSGTVSYTCWMGMITGRIIVVDSLDEAV